MYQLTLPAGKGQFKQATSFALCGLSNFNLQQIADSGQCFRMKKITTTDTGKVHYQIVAYDTVALVCQLSEENIEICCEPDKLDMWLSYFDISQYDRSVIVYSELSQMIQGCDDAVLKEAFNGASGIRILNQELLETGISFITSANNNIPRITKLIETLCDKYGKLVENDITAFHTFPDKFTLLNLTEEDWRNMGFGFRAPYLVDFVKWYSTLPIDYVPTKKDLVSIKGVGEKIAACIQLFSLHNLEVVPMDTWMKKVKQSLYKDEEFPWQKYRGVCQQYIYYYYRTVKEESQWRM